MVVMALLSTAVLVALPALGGPLRGEAERFAARAGAAREQAILGAAPVALRVTAAGHGLDHRRGGAWVPATERAFRDQAWGDGVVVASDTPRIVFDSTGLAEPARVTLRRGAEQLAVAVGGDGSVRVVG